MFSKILKLINERTNIAVRHKLNRDLELLKEEALGKGFKTYQEFETYLYSYYGKDFWKLMNSSPIFTPRIFDNDLKSAYLEKLLAPTAPEIYKKISRIPIFFGNYRSQFVVGLDKDNNEIIQITINNKQRPLKREEDLIHELEHALSYVANPEFHIKNWEGDYSSRLSLVVNDQTTRQEIQKFLKDYENSPIEKIANANMIKRAEAQQHFKSPEEFWNLEIEPYIGK